MYANVSNKKPGTAEIIVFFIDASALAHKPALISKKELIITGH